MQTQPWTWRRQGPSHTTEDGHTLRKELNQIKKEKAKGNRKD